MPMPLSEKKKKADHKKEPNNHSGQHGSDSRAPRVLFFGMHSRFSWPSLEELDAGDIITQQAIPVEVGISYEKLEGQCAELGGQLLVQCIRDVYKGHAQRIPQDEAKSSYHSYPVESDFIIPVAEWHAVRVYNFLRGVKAWGEAMKVHVNNKDIIVDGGLAFTTDDSNIPVQHIHDAFFRRSGLLWVRCKTGWAAVIPL